MFGISTFNASKLRVSFIPPASEWVPVEHRKYTLTHSDVTGDLFLDIGCHFNLSVINKQMRDEFLAEWISLNGHYALRGEVYVSGGEFDESASIKRFHIFQREAKTALSAIVYGDRGFFTSYPQLLDSSIFIEFKSIYPQLHQTFSYGTPRLYIN